MIDLPFKVAEYPERKCRLPFGEELNIMHSCDLRQWHKGPCASLSSRPSITRRIAWELNHPEDTNGIDENDIIL